MKLTIVVGYWGPSGGIEQLLHDIAEVFLDFGWRVNVISTGVADRGEDTENSNLKVIAMAPKQKILRALWGRLVKWWLSPLKISLYSRNSDLVIFGHVNRISELKYLLNNHTSWLWVYGLEVWGENAKTVSRYQNRFHRIISISHYTSIHLLACCDPDNIRIIPCVVDINVYKPTTSTSAIRRDEILISGRMVQGRPKGHDVLIDNLVPISQRLGRKVFLRIVGSGNDCERLKDKVLKMGVSDQVTFSGRISNTELVEAYQHCSLFCMPAEVGQDERNRWFGEGFGIVYLEAAACGRPVLASSEGGAPETIVDGKTGYLVNPKDPESVLSRICQLLSDPGLCDRMGMEGRQLMEEKFSFKSFKQKIGKELESL